MAKQTKPKTVDDPSVDVLKIERGTMDPVEPETPVPTLIEKLAAEWQCPICQGKGAHIKEQDGEWVKLQCRHCRNPTRVGIPRAVDQSLKGLSI